MATGLPAGRYRRSGHHGGLTVSCKRRFGIVGGSGLYRFNGLFDAVLNFALNLPHDFGVAGFFLQGASVAVWAQRNTRLLAKESQETKDLGRFLLREHINLQVEMIPTVVELRLPVLTDHRAAVFG